MTLAYSYPTKEEAEAAITDGTALAFFQPFIDTAIANAWEPDRPYWRSTDARLRVGVRARKYGRYSSPTAWMVYLNIEYNVRARASWGDTDIVVRKGGDVNQELLNAAIWGLLHHRGSSDRAAKARAANNNVLDALPEHFRAYVEAEGSEGHFRLSFREGGISFSRTVSFDEIVPILTALQTAASTIDGIRYPDQKDS